MKKTILALTFLLPHMLWAQTTGEKLSAFSRNYLADYQGALQQNPLARAKAKAAGRDLSASTEVAVFIHLNEEADAERLRAEGVKIGTVAAGIATARLPISEIERVAALPAVRFLEIAPPAHARMDEARKVTHVDEVLQAAELTQAYTGKGVVIGILDSGFQYDHLNFRTADGASTRIQRVWDQCATSGTAPAGFSYGTELTTTASIVGAQTDTNESTHGCHVAGCAAGNMVNTTKGVSYSSAAPEADIVLVSLDGAKVTDGSTAVIVDAIKYVYDYAASVGKPAVVNLSLGSHYGPHDGTSAFDVMTDALQGPGKLLVGSVGNEGNLNFHLSHQFAGTEGDTLRTFPSFTYSMYTLSELEVWGDAGKTFTFIPSIYNVKQQTTTSTFEPCTLSLTEAGTKDYQFTTTQHGIDGKMHVVTEVDPTNGKPHMIVSLYIYTSDQYRPAFAFTSTAPTRLDIWTDGIYSMLDNYNVAGYSKGDTDCTMGEIGGTGKRIISVGAYTSRDHRFNFGIYYPSDYGTLGDLCNFSSHGPTPDGRIKPEITAPGAFVASSLNSHYTGSKSREANIVNGSEKFEVGYMAGTSMSSPIAAGVLAAWLQAYPEMTPEDVRTVLAASADTDDFTGNVSAGSNLWGYGKLNAYKGIKQCLLLASGLQEVEIDHTGRTPAATAYYAITGQRLLQPTPGTLVIKQVRYTDGTVLHSKEIFQAR